MKTIRNKVLLCGIDNLTSLGQIRELGENGIPFSFLAIGKCSVVIKSKYCKDIIFLKDLNACIQYLMKNYDDEEYKPILIISSDRLACEFDILQDELSKKYILPCTSKPGSLPYYIDKFNMVELAKSVGIPCLETKKIDKFSCVEDVSYPCFIKPCIETPGYYNEFKYKICTNHKDLINTLKMVRVESKFVLQRLLRKENELVVYGCRMRDGEVIFSGVMFQDRFAESGFASHGYITRVIPHYIDVDKLKKFIEVVDYYGPFDFEFGIENGKAYYLETNFRCVGPTCFFHKSGANIVAAYVYSCAKLDYSNISCYVKQDNWCIDELYDIENVLMRRISYKEWKTSKDNATLYRFYDVNDMAPYMAESQRRFIQIVKDIVLKKYRMYIVRILEKFGLKK